MLNSDDGESFEGFVRPIKFTPAASELEVDADTGDVKQVEYGT